MPGPDTVMPVCKCMMKGVGASWVRYGSFNFQKQGPACSIILLQTQLCLKLRPCVWAKQGCSLT